MTREVGALSEAWRMPTEVRRWWIDQMVREARERQEEIDRSMGRRTADVK